MSIPIKNTPIFNHLYSYTQPTTNLIYEHFHALQKDFTTKVLKPSKEKIETTFYKKVDEVSTKMSSIKREEKETRYLIKKSRNFFKKTHHNHEEHYREQDKQGLLDLL